MADNMPRGDGTGPLGRGFGTGGGRGLGRGRNQGNRPGAGAIGNCICPSCGKKIVHTQGIPCYSVLCPECGIKMIRE
ncbi:MAG: hypothetical protein JW822_03615 [Spirochaetales bacterium]|nr:hypothetical protein [Spirochaetales bacterium]